MKGKVSWEMLTTQQWPSYTAFNFCAFLTLHVTGVVPGPTNMWEQMEWQSDTKIHWCFSIYWGRCWVPCHIPCKWTWSPRRCLLGDHNKSNPIESCHSSFVPQQALQSPTRSERSRPPRAGPLAMHSGGPDAQSHGTWGRAPLLVRGAPKQY